MIVDQHFLTSIDATAIQFNKVGMGYAGYDTQLIQELLFPLLGLRGEHLDGNFLAILQFSLHISNQSLSTHETRLHVWIQWLVPVLQ